MIVYFNLNVNSIVFFSEIMDAEDSLPFEGPSEPQKGRNKRRSSILKSTLGRPVLQVGIGNLFNNTLFCF